MTDRAEPGTLPAALPRRRWAAFCGVALLLAGWCWLVLRTWSHKNWTAHDFSVWQGYSHLGESLILNLALPYSATPSWSMPGFSMLAAYLFDHQLLSRLAFISVACLTTLLLGWALSRILSSSRGALLAVLLLLLPLRSISLYYYPHCVLPALVLLVAGLLVWEAQSPSLIRSLLVALAIGASLLFRSTLGFFGPFLVIMRTIGKSRRAPQVSGSCWWNACILIIVPYLFLIPWLRLNWRLHQAICPFEYGQANSNIVTGALGLTQTVEGDWTALTDGSLQDIQRPGAVLTWAVRHLARHWMDYGTAYLKRLAFAFWLQPWLFLMAALAVWIQRGREDVKRLASLSAYLLLTHCLVSVQREYFAPLWPLLAILGAAGLSSWRRWDGPPNAAGPRRMALFLMHSFLACVLAWSILVERTISVYAPEQSPSPRSLEAAALAHPDNAWLRWQYGKHKLRSHDNPEAIAQLTAASRLWRTNPGIAMDLAWAQALAGEPGPLLDDGNLARAGQPPIRYEAIALHIKRAVVHLNSGTAAAADQLLAAAWRESHAIVQVREGQTAKGAEAYKRLFDTNRILSNELALTVDCLPPAQAIALLCEAEKVWGIKLPEPWTSVLVALDSQGVGYAMQKKYDAAMRIFNQALHLTTDRAWHSKLYSDRGVAWSLAGRPEEALRDFKKALQADAGNLAAYLSAASAYARLGRRADALALLRQAPPPQAAAVAGESQRLWAELTACRAELTAMAAPKERAAYQ